MAQVYGAEYVSLHVRKTNRAAISLYRDSLGYTVHDVEKGYCKRSSCCLIERASREAADRIRAER